MRAAVLPGVDQKVEIRDDVEASGPGPGEVRIKIVATGVCHSDLSAQTGTLPLPVPLVLGHEGAGEVIAVGDGVTGVEVGDHVIIAWVPPCGACSWCIGGQPSLCMTNLIQAMTQPNFSAAGEPLYGFAGIGTFAEELVVPASAAVKIPADIPLDVASLIGCGVATGVGAVVNTARLRPGSSAVVFGCGGVGLSVIQGARIAGAAEIVAVDLVPSKLELAKRLGATHAVTPGDLASVESELTGGEGFDYAFEVVGLSKTIRDAYDATRRGGTTVIVGAGHAEDMVSFNAFELFYSAKSILGCYYGSVDVRADFPRLLRLWRQGQLDLESMISRRITVDEVNDAFEALKRGEVVRSVIEFR